jgi:hypothetical protein
VAYAPRDAAKPVSTTELDAFLERAARAVRDAA